MKKNSVTLAQFTYDGEGKRVKSVMGSETILFVGGYYEIRNPGAGQQVTKYYFAGASRIAMRKYTIPSSMAVEYLLSDHLGSTSIVTDASGNVVSQTKYKAWGEVRYSSGSEVTKYQYTGQYSHSSDFGLLFYNARFYDPALKRFVSADPIVPPGVQGLDRYAYVNNSPMNYVDPSGHNPQCGPDGVWCSNNFEEAYGITFEGSWTEREKAMARVAIRAVAYKFLQALGIGGNPAKAFSLVFSGGMTLARVNSYKNEKGEEFFSGAITKSDHRIEFASLPRDLGGTKTAALAFKEGINNIVHELGHAFASKWWYKDKSSGDILYNPNGPYGTLAPIPAEYQNNEGFHPAPDGAERMWRQHPCAAGESDCQNETYADMFLGWTFDKWADNSTGQWRNNYMTTYMVYWVSEATKR
ncbi:MAG: hypothetical protein HND47_21210 [Chloroflexi bacterium]|nr:hypothetical protein [Chloroflexota bacterium]